MICLWAFGRIFVQKDVFSSLLSGILVSGGIVAVTARFIPLYTRELVCVMAVAGILNTVREVWTKGRKIPFEINPWFMVVFLFTAFYFRFFHYSNYVYQSHDIVYLGSAFEILSSDYWGNLRVPTYYPFEMAANHLLPSAILAAIGFISPEPNILLFEEIKYLLIVLFLSNFFFQLYRIIQPKNVYIFGIVTISMLMIYGEEFSYNLIITSFVYIFVSFQILLLIFEKEQKKKEILFFTIFLVACKAPIFYIAFSMGIYFWYHYKSERFHPIVLIAGLITLCNVVTWASFPPPGAPGSGGFNLINPLNMREVLYSAHFYQWTVVDNFKLVLEYFLSPIDFSGFGGNYPSLIDLLRSRWNSILALVVVIVYIIIKYYAVFWIGWKKIYSFMEIGSIEMRGLLLYMAVSLVGWIVVRNDEIIDHQAHAYFLAAMISMTFAIILVSNERKWFLVIPFALFFLYGKDPSHVLMEHSGFARYFYAKTAMKESEVMYQEGQNGFYIPAPGTPFWKMELESMILGLRLAAKDAPPLEDMSWDDGNMRYWVLK